MARHGLFINRSGANKMHDKLPNQYDSTNYSTCVLLINSRKAFECTKIIISLQKYIWTWYGEWTLFTLDFCALYWLRTSSIGVISIFSILTSISYFILHRPHNTFFCSPKFKTYLNPIVTVLLCIIPRPELSRFRIYVYSYIYYMYLSYPFTTFIVW